MTEYVIDPKKPLPRPEWVEKTNAEGRMWAAAGMLSHVVPLDEASILASAYQMTGLNDMGEDDWQEPLRIMLRSFEEEADLNLIGRLCSRSELLIWITSRLRIVDLVKRHPEIRDEPIEKPIFVTGLPRTGTSILQELLGQDPNMRTPLFWECYFPGEAAESGGKDAAARASGDALVNQWARVVPEIRTMHETGGDIPAEDATVWNYSLMSDHIMSFYQMPSYDRFFNQIDASVLYRYHKLFLQVLQWRRPRQQWFGKTLYHLGHMPSLFEVYPDARIIHTHRDPLRSMASVTSLLRAFYWQRSDKDFDVPGFDEIMLPAPTAQRLEAAMEIRDQGLVPKAQIVDSRYQDLMDDPVGAMRKIYVAFGIPFTDDTAARITTYLAHKPKHKFGAHEYKTMSAEAAKRVRPLFRRYQDRYNVPDEV